MNVKNIRSILFGTFVFLFLCLLLSGSSRLIARDQVCETAASARMLCSIPAALTVSQSSAQESACPWHGRNLPVKRESVLASVVEDIPTSVLCDANGNVLGRRSYMHEVYQVFSLGDGFA